MSRHLLPTLWIVVIVALAVVASAAVDATSDATRRFLAFEPFHIVGHLGLFAVLAVLLAAARPARPMLSVCVFVAAALAQEGAQALIPGHAITLDSVFDVAVDLVGGALGLVAFRWWRRRRAARPT